MSHKSNNLMDPSNSLNPLNPFSPLNPDYEKNVQGAGEAIDGLPKYIKALLAVIWVAAFCIGFSGFLPSVLLSNLAPLPIIPLLGSSLGSILFTVFFCTMFTFFGGLVPSSLVILCYALLAGLVELFLKIYHRITSGTTPRHTTHNQMWRAKTRANRNNRPHQRYSGRTRTAPRNGSRR